MKHTKNYMDAMWVVENPEKYDNRDVVRANSFIEAYNEGYNKALSLVAVIGRSEQLPCDCGVMLKETTIQVFCPKCYKTWKMK